MGRINAREGMESGVPHPIDIHVGARLRLRRGVLALSQDALGKAVGLTFQQIQKYEWGTNRISASSLFDFAQALDTTVAYFFDDLPDELQAGNPGEAQGGDVARTTEALNLVRAFYCIKDLRVRRRIYELGKSLSGSRMAARRRAAQ